MRQIVADLMSEQRFPMILLGAFAGLALLLAAVGNYWVISYSVTQRVPEIAIRMALGADKKSVVSLFVVQELRLVCTGIVVGAFGALILTRTLASLSHLLYGIRWRDPLTFGSESVVLIGAALSACYIPARRATKGRRYASARYE
jgi:ABC-type antimicrobial peptide transport system permease subunit